MDTRFSLGTKLTLEVTVTDRDKSQELLGWLYNEHSTVDKENFGCELEKIGFGHAHEKLQRVERILSNLVHSSDLDDWLINTEKQLGLGEYDGN